MKKILIIIISIFSIFAYSCNIDELPVEVDPDYHGLWIQSTVFPNYFLQFSQSYEAFFDNMSGELYINSIINSYDQCYGGHLTFMNYEIPFYDEYYLRSIYFDDSLNPKPDFGDSLEFRLGGYIINGVDSLSQKVYFPLRIEISEPQNYSVCRSNSSLTIKWNPDPEYTGQVGILLRDEGTSNDKAISWEILTADDGFYELPLKVVKNFPVGVSVSLYLGRGCEYYNSSENAIFRTLAYDMAILTFEK